MVEENLKRQLSKNLINFDGEIWKNIKGYENYYMISNYGRVKSLERYIERVNGRVLPVKEKIINQRISKRVGEFYYRVGLSNSKVKWFSVHRLLGIHFIDGFDEVNDVVDHINGDTIDNRLENLRKSSVRNNSINKKSASKLATGVTYSANYRRGGFIGYESAILINKKNYHLGTFKELEHASNRYQETKQKLEEFEKSINYGKFIVKKIKKSIGDYNLEFYPI